MQRHQSPRSLQSIPLRRARTTQSAPPAPQHQTRHPRLDATVGITAVNIRKLPADNHVGGLPAGIFASAAYFWTPHLATQVELESSVETWNPDYAWEYVVRPVLGGRFEEKSITLKHNYVGGRRTMAQLVQVGTKTFRPYFGAGVGIETQTVGDSRSEWSRVLLEGEPVHPNAKAVGEFPTQFPSPTETRYVIAFAQVGLKVFAGRRSYFLIDWKLMNANLATMRVGCGVELF